MKFSSFPYLLLVLLFLPLLVQAQLYPVPLTERVAESAIVVEAKVISQRAFWNEDQTLIFTENVLEVSKQFKGQPQPYIHLITSGGVLGNTMIKVSEYLELEVGMTGIFACVASPVVDIQFPSRTFVSAYAEMQGFVQYHEPEGASTVFEQYADLDTLYGLIESYTGHPYTVVKPGGYNTLYTQQRMTAGIDSMYPLTITAGTKSVLTIVGLGFGVTKGNVGFYNTDNLSSYFNCLSSEILTWTDTLITVQVPPKAAGFNVRVLPSTGGTFTSTSVLDVGYNVTNHANGGINHFTYHQNHNGHGGYTFVFDGHISANVGISRAFISALDKWKCSTGFNADIADTIAAQRGLGLDGVNLVTYSNTLPTGVLGACISYYNSCNGGITWNVVELDIQYPNRNWHTGTGGAPQGYYDLESVFLHELGHGHQLQHSNKAGTSNVMYFSISTGTTRRDLHASNIDGGLFVVGQSTATHSCGIPMTAVNLSNCNPTGIFNNVGLTIIHGLTDTICKGTAPIGVSFKNLGIRTTSSVRLGWSVNNVFQSFFDWTGTIATGDSAGPVNLGSYPFVYGNQTIKVWIMRTNGSNDGDTSNDTLTFSFFVNSCEDYDAAIFNIYPLPDCPNIYPVYARIANKGVSPIDSVILNWTVNGVAQPAALYVALLQPGEIKDSVLLGYFNFRRGVYNLIASSSITSLADGESANDTASFTYNYLKLNGTYTLGGTTPDFADFYTLRNSLKVQGVCGPVTIAIRPGNYNEPFTIDGIPGVSATDTVLITSEAGDSSSVVWTHYYPFAPDWHIIKMDNIHHVTFNKLTLKVQSSAYDVVLLDSCSHITFDEILFLDTVPTNLNRKTFIKSVYYPCNNIVVTNNRFINGNAAMEGGFHNSLIQYNKLENQYRPLNITLKNTHIKDNQIALHPFYYGLDISCFNSSQNSIVRNSITGGGAHNSSALKLSAGNNFGSSDSMHIITVANNYINTRLNGIVADPFSHALIANNTIAVSDGHCILLSITANFPSLYDSMQYLTVRNNLLVALGPNAKMIHALDGFRGSDYNAYANTNFVIGGSSVTFSQWQQSKRCDYNSIIITPQFVAPNQPYLVMNANNYRLFDAGQPGWGINTDFDNSPRSSIPDIGAIELALTTVANDIGCIDAAVTNGCNGGLANVQVRLKNYGNNSIASARINWSVNGVPQAPFTWNGNLPVGGISALINIGSYTNNLQAPDELSIWTSLPNNSIDTVSYNDTTTFTHISRVSGIITVGGTNPDFTNIDTAVNYIVERGMCGNTTINLRQGAYYKLNIPYISGDSIFTLTVQAENGDSTSVSFTYAECIGANNVILNHLTLNDGVFINSSSDLTVNRCHFPGNPFSFAIEMIGWQCKNINITNSYFNQRNTAINAVRRDKNFNGLTISSNKFINVGQAVNIQHMLNVTITDNFHEYGSGSGWAAYYFNEVENLVFSNNISISTRKGLEMFYSTGKVFNNILYSIGTSALSHTSNATSEFIHNTIISEGFSVAVTVGAYSEFKNNIVFVNGTSNCMSTTPFSSDYNLYYTRGSYVIGSYTSLAAYQSATGRDINSIFDDPILHSDYAFLNNAINNKGTPIPGISTDIYGTLRNIATPDIGAIETTPRPHDAQLIAIPRLRYCNVGDSVYVSLYNRGYDTLRSATLQWYSNGTANANLNWTGALATGDTILVNLGPHTFISDSSTIIAIVTNPNGMVDADNSNDTVSRIVYTSLSGTYTIGGSNPDFAAPHDAVDRMHHGGICGPVVFNIRDGVYNDSIRMRSIVGVSPTNTITFQSESANHANVTIVGSNATVSLDSVPYVTLKNISLTKPPFSSIVILGVKSHNTTITGCRLYADSTTILVSVARYNDSLIIENNIFENGTTAINLASSPTGVYQKNYIIRGNSFLNQKNNAIILRDLTYMQFQGNSIVTGGWSTSHGISVSDCKYTTIAQNNISSTGNAVALFECVGGIIANNMITLNSVISNINGGVFLNDTDSFKIYNNTIVDLSGNIYRPFGLLNIASTSRSNEIYNNIFSNKNSGSVCVVYRNPGTAFHSRFNNNLYHAKGDSIMLYYPNSVTPQYHTSLTTWRSILQQDSASIQADPLLVSINDLHLTSSSPAIARGRSLAEVVVDIDGDARTIPYDIGADEFSFNFGDLAVSGISSPTLINCNGPTDVNTTFTNMGQNTITSILVHWSVNGISQAPYSWSGTLPPGQSTAPIMIGSYIFSQHGPHTISIHVSTPGMVDNNNSNDTLSVTFLPQPYLPFNLGPDTSLCLGGSLNLIAGAGYSSYLWSDGSTAATLAASSIGTYSVTATDGNGCTFADTVTISQATSILVNLGNDTLVCGGSIALTPGNFTSYQWSTGQSSATITVSHPGTYTITVTNAAGCIGTDTITVDFLSIPTPVILASDTFCVGVADTLKAQGGVSYLWSTGETDSVIVRAFSANASVTVTVSNGPNCSASTTKTIFVDAATAPVISGNTTYCEGETGVLTISNSSPGVVYNLDIAPTLTYQLLGDSVLLAPLPAGSYTVNVMGINSNGCGSVALPTMIMVNSLPLADAGADVDLCQGDTAVLVASGGTSYVWSNGTTTATNTVAPTSSTVYQVTATLNGCSGIDTVTVSPILPPSVVIGISGNEMSTGAGFDSYQWYLDGLPITGATLASITGILPGNYLVNVMYNGCSYASASQSFVPVGVTDIDNSSTLTVGPNPVTDWVTFKATEPITRIAFQNVLGQTISDELAPNSDTYKFSMQHLAAGCYIVQVYTLNGAHKVRLIKE